MSDTFTVNVELPEGMLEQIKGRAKWLQFHDVQFYIRWLIAKDVAPESADADHMMALVHESDLSGEGRVVDEAYLRELNERLDRMLREKAGKAQRAAG